MRRQALWSRDETILALDLAVSAGCRAYGRDPDVIALSRLLRGDRAELRYRNTYGVACKVRRLAALVDGRSLRGGAAMEGLLCREFAGRPAALAAAVAAARSALARSVAAAPSRGPEPTFGESAVSRRDGPTFVYFARLVGGSLPDGRLLAKVGRSADVGRRMDELNGGFPSPLGLCWRPVATWRYGDGGAAHAAEQAMLSRWAAAGCSVGGEFIAGDADLLAAVVEEGPEPSARCARRPSPSAPASRGRRPARSRRRARRRG